MKYLRFAAIAALLSTFLACAPNHARERPFTPEWNNHVRGERAFEQRKARIEGREVDAPAEEGEGRAGIVRDESGDPKFRLGGDRGISADLDYGRGPEGRLKYRREFDFARPTR